MTDVGNELVVPVTGQIVDLDNPVQVAQVLYDIAEAQDQLKYFKRALVEALEPLRATVGKSTIELGDYEVVLSSNAKSEVDLVLLRELLTELGLPEHRMDELIVQTTTEKLDWSVARQLRGANPVYAEALDKATSKVPATVYATVTRGR